MNSTTSKFASRKFYLAFLTLIVATLLLAVPPWFGKVLLDGTMWVSVVSIVFAAYFAANVIQHKGENGKIDGVVKPNEEGEA